MFEEVQRSNMSKTCSTQEEAQKTQDYYNEKDGTISEIIKRGNEYIVYRKPDGKVLKSINYSKADLSKFLDS